MTFGRLLSGSHYIESRTVRFSGTNSRPTPFFLFNLESGHKAGLNQSFGASSWPQTRIDAGFTSITSLDFSNALNSVSWDDIANGINTFAPDFLNAARWAYCFESDLFINKGEGANRHQVFFRRVTVRTAILFPHYFALSSRKFLFTSDRITSSSPTWTRSSSWGPGGGALRQVNAFLSDRRSPLSLNPAKCWEQRLDDLRDNGAEILGSLIGPGDKRAAFLASAVDQQRQLIARLPSFPHQHALLLLRMCNQANLRHLMRSLVTSDIDHLWTELDGVIREELYRIRGRKVRAGC